MDYEFTLAVDRDPTGLADKLFDIAEGDLVPEGGAGVNVVHAYREADSFAAALFGAVKDVESTGLVVTGIASDDLVSLRDIATRLGRTYESVRLIAAGKRGSGGFPTPLSTGQWSLYSWAEVSAWFSRSHGTEAPSTYDREIAAADHLIRARRILAGDEQRHQLGKLVTL
ncbi:hypothetical protein KXD96_15475 [Mycobacterium sp. SMC-2]|uniref:hypothetical protein n=1 Tax=Mycobacterium sp. SMC-2 TaxID=2857058 RepID=UPI0021B38F8A|nr:hypothetical protein [Mycobacterium sp. SMC-2]UXA04428.1 hypothetical protein KXD96_15475 [Mycobacterium sp. SMC-2]